MYNLLKYRGTFKGLIGEAMFKLTRKNAFMTRFHSYYFIESKYKNYFTEDQLRFLKDNWHSLDVIEISKDNTTLFEVKTQNYLNYKLGYNHKITKNTFYLYSNAKNLGFKTKVAKVQLMGDWNYQVLVDEFDYVFFSIDKPKKYDKISKYNHNNKKYF